MKVPVTRHTNGARSNRHIREYRCVVYAVLERLTRPCTPRLEPYVEHRSFLSVHSLSLYETLGFLPMCQSVDGSMLLEGLGAAGRTAAAPYSSIGIAYFSAKVSTELRSAGASAS
jgi:hypothetical protein